MIIPRPVLGNHFMNNANNPITAQSILIKININVFLSGVAIFVTSIRHVFAIYSPFVSPDHER